MKLQLSLTTALMLTTAVAMANCGNQKVQNNQAATPDAIQQAGERHTGRPADGSRLRTDRHQRAKQFRLSSP